LKATDKPVKEDTAFATIVAGINNSLDGTFGEIVTYFLENFTSTAKLTTLDQSYVRGWVNYAVRSGVITIVSK